jgi:hypothetical protein
VRLGAGVLALTAAAIVASWIAVAPAAAVDVVLVPDVAVTMIGVPLLTDRDALRDGGATSQRRLVEEVPELPDGIAIAALDYDSQGRLLLAIDGWAELPGAGLVGPAHVVRGASGGSFAVEFSGPANGIPDGVAIDAVAEIEGSLFLSFDVAVSLEGFVLDDEDLLGRDPILGLYWFDLTADVPAGLDTDGLSQPRVDPEFFTLSFDGSGSIGGIAFDDEDIVTQTDVTTWVLVGNLSAASTAWNDANLAAFAWLPPEIFADAFESGDTTPWSSTSP